MRREMIKTSTVPAVYMHADRPDFGGRIQRIFDKAGCLVRPVDDIAAVAEDLVQGSGLVILETDDNIAELKRIVGEFYNHCPENTTLPIVVFLSEEAADGNVDLLHWLMNEPARLAALWTTSRNDKEMAAELYRFAGIAG